jgi:hypothetical protein
LSGNDHTDDSLLRARIAELESELLRLKSELAAAANQLKFTAAVKKAFEQDQRENTFQEQIFGLEIEAAKYRAEASTLHEQITRLKCLTPGEGEMIVKPNMPPHPLNRQDKVAFVIMPFGPKWSKGIETAIQVALRECDFEYRRADKVNARHIMLDIIWKSICECGLVVADVTDCNPNVLYELGLAEVIGKKIIIISQTVDPRKLAFDLLGLQLILYSKTKPHDLTKKLIDALQSTGTKAVKHATAK